MTREQERRWPKRIRLDRELYGVPYQVIAVTISCYHRRQFFASDEFAVICRDALQAVAAQHAIGVLAYCFMPDHLHLLLEPRAENNVIDFVQRYKSWTTRLAWRYGIDGKIWQPRFYDHILRREDDVMRHVAYIVENPIRAGLVQQWYEYPHVGSQVYDIEDFNW